MAKHANNKDRSPAPAPSDELILWNDNLTRALGRSGEACTKACLDWQQEVVSFVGMRVDRDRRAQQHLVTCRNLGDLTKAQEGWALEAVKDYLNEASRLSEIASRLAQTAMAPLYEASRRALGAGQE